MTGGTLRESSSTVEYSSPYVQQSQNLTLTLTIKKKNQTQSSPVGTSGFPSASTTPSDKQLFNKSAIAKDDPTNNLKTILNRKYKLFNIALKKLFFRLKYSSSAVTLKINWSPSQRCDTHQKLGPYIKKKNFENANEIFF